MRAHSFLRWALTLGAALALPSSKVRSSKVTGDEAAASALDEARALSDWTVKLRRALHAEPELLYALHGTSAYVRARLDELKIPYKWPIAGEGIVASVGTGASPCVGLRADMDALPIFEADRACPFRSQTDGKMHACGHDGHTAMLLAAARILKARELAGTLAGTVKFIFQPAEEGGAGGLAMVQAGILDAAPRIERVFAMHVWPGLPAGTVASRSGTLMAAAGFFHARIGGHGGHAAMPHTTVDPLMCVGAALSALQTIVARNLSPTEAGVVSTTFVNGGSAYNVIPHEAEMGGTIRSLTKPGYRFLEERVRAVLKGSAEALGCTLNLTTSSLDDDCLGRPTPPGAPGSCTFPPTRNAKAAWALARAAATAVVGAEQVLDGIEPTLGGEDFAYLLEKRPGAMVFLGIGNVSKGTDVNLHSPKFKLDEDQLPIGAALHVEIALASLAAPSAPGCGGETDDDDAPAAESAQCAMGTNIEGDD